ncbi:pleiotropic drug resistance protein 1-like protein [Tanacetum coccineum]
MQSPSLQPPPKSSSQPVGEHIKEDKGKKALSLEKAEKESTDSDSDDETHVTGSMVEPSRTKKLKKFDFITEDGRHIHLTEEEINHQKKLEEDAKAEAAKQEGEVRKAKLVDLLGLEVVKKYYNDKLQRAISRITNCDVLTRKGPITLKVYREDGTSEIIPNFKASELHLGEWREVMKACPNKTGKGWEIIYKQIGTRMDYVHMTEAELANKRLKSSVQYKDHLPGTVLNEPILGMIMFNSYHRQDFVTIKDLKDFSNTMLYTVQEIFFRRHQGPGLDDHARTFSSLLLAKIDKRNLNPLKQMRVIEQLRQGRLLAPSASALQVLRRLGSIFTSVYAAVQKLKKDSCAMSRYQFISGSNINRPELAFEVYPILLAIPIPRKSQRGFGIAGSIGQTSNANLDMGDDVDINTLTMEQYLALIQDNIRPGIVKPKIGDDVEFEINRNFMRELRHKLFKGTDEEDAHEHVRRVLEIADLFHFPRVTHDAVMLRVFPITLTGSALRWKNRFSAGSITTWDLLEKAFIRKYCPPFKTTMKLEKIRNFKQEMDKTLYHA